MYKNLILSQKNKAPYFFFAFFTAIVEQPLILIIMSQGFKYKEDNDFLVSALLLTNRDKQILINTKLSSLKIDLNAIPLQGRNTIGLSLIKTNENNSVTNSILLEKS